jgi:RNA polymerase sigma-70 factor (ECF subfamily)
LYAVSVSAPSFAQASSRPEEDADWCERFWEGDRAALNDCYRCYFDVVDRSAGKIIQGVDRETVVQEVFARLVESEKTRRSFKGGNLAAWLTVVARNQALGLLRKHKREVVVEPETAERLSGGWEDNLVSRMNARALMDKFREEHLPEKWLGVFQERFLGDATQHEAAAKLNMSRTTLAYQEMRIRRSLTRFVLNHGRSS